MVSFELDKLCNSPEMVHDAQTLGSPYGARIVFMIIDGARIDDFTAMGHVFARQDLITPRLTALLLPKPSPHNLKVQGGSSASVI